MLSSLEEADTIKEGPGAVSPRGGTCSASMDYIQADPAEDNALKNHWKSPLLSSLLLSRVFLFHKALLALFLLSSLIS